MSKCFSFVFILGFIAQSTAQTDVLFTDFQLGIPASFTLIDNDGFTPDDAVAEYSNAWISKPDPEDGTNLTASSTSYFSPTGTASRWLITNQMTLGSFGNFMTWNAKSHDPSFPDGYLVLVSTTSNQIADFTDTIGNVNGEYADWTARSIDLSAEGYNNQTVYFAFVNKTNNGFKLYLDSLHVWKEDPVGINETEEVQLAMYPNPFTNSISIKADFQVDYIELLDFNGKLLATKESSNVINTEFLKPGIYLVKVYANNKVYVRKVIKN
ncbi:MAG: choice-of-anchor J domain-containing protein [Bacteroidota bacterium]